MASAQRLYPRKIEITRAVEAAKACGLDVAGIEITAGGGIRIVEARAIPKAENDFDRWEDRL